MIKKISMLSLLGLLSIPAFADVNSQSTANNDQAAADAIWNALPKYTIKAGSHTAAQNKEHQAFCSQYGDKDITDKVDIQVGYDNLDPMNSTVFCMGNGKLNIEGNLAGVGVVPSNNPTDFLSGAPSNNQVSHILPYPINGNAPIGRPWWIQAYATYQYTAPGRPFVGVRGVMNGSDCIAAAQEYIQGPNSHIVYRRGCVPMYGSPGSRATTDYGYITGPNPASGSAPGEVNFYN